MANNLSLKWKIALVGAFPVMFIIGFGGRDLWKRSASVARAHHAHADLELIERASALAHETQQERALSATFLRGKGGEELAAQKLATDAAWANWGSAVEGSSFDQSYKKELISLRTSYDSLRENVARRSIGAAQAVQDYRAILNRLGKIEKDAKLGSGIPHFAQGLQSVRALEHAKEYAARLRGTLTHILADNRAITEEQVSYVLSLKAGLEGNLDASEVPADKLRDSLEWQEASDALGAVLKNSSKGVYGKDSRAYFETMSSVVKAMNTMLKDEHAELGLSLEAYATRSERSLWAVALALAASLFASFACTVYGINSVNQRLRGLSLRLRDSSLGLGKVTLEIAQGSGHLASASTQQASSLQETVSSVDEISAMISKNAESAEESRKVSEKGKAVSQHGIGIVKEMLSSIQDISDSNQAVMHQMEESNKEFSEIVRVISDIGEKTKVINDIVFQTKLLSFNASVEAARAGEHGKGFAVVAEEVGNLASMSGKAATEITGMLEESIRKVENIVKSTKSKVDELVLQGRQKVESGLEKAQKCNQSLEQILESIETVNDMVGEIATASKEQAQGVQEITKAVSQLDQVTRQNAGIAEQTSGCVGRMQDQTGQLDGAVDELLFLVHGNSPEREQASTTSGPGGNVVSLDVLRTPMGRAQGS